MSITRRIVLLSWLAAFAAAPASAQLQLASIRGVVLDAAGAPAAGAAIDLTDPLGGIVASRATDAAGRFVFEAVSPGRYSLRATVGQDDPLVHALSVDGALPLEITLRFPLRTNLAVIVDEAVAPPPVMTRASIAGDSVARVPARSLTKGIQDVVATLPGWATEDNGLLHVRGTDDGFLYVIDGVPVYERLDQLSGLGPDVATVESINVVTGYIPAEFGYKAGGVIDVRSKLPAAEWTGTVHAGVGTEHDTNGALSAGGRLGPSVTMSLGIAAQQTDRFLDPVHPDNLHNDGRAIGGTGQLAWTATNADLVNLSFGSGRMEYDVPNTEEQHAVDQDQHQRIRQGYGSVSWQRAWSASTFSQLSGYVRHSGSRLDGSPQDLPLYAGADRTLTRAGAIAALTRQVGSSAIKAGFEIQRLRLDESFVFAVTDDDAAEEAGLSEDAREFDEDNPFSFSGRATPTMWSAFVQDDWTATDRLSVSAGLRFDDSRLLLHRWQLSPRVGVAYRAAARTTVRGSVSRFFQPPQPENLLLSSSEAARALSPFADADFEGGAEVDPERQWAYETGVEHRLASRLRFDVAVWRRQVTQAADPNVFAGTTIIFPNAVARGRAHGIDVRIEVPRRRSWSGYVNAAIGRVRQNGPITGGLFLEDDVGDVASGEEFIPDHDQLIVAGGGLTWAHPHSGAAVSTTVRYESGTPIGEDEDELRDRPGAELVDFDRGRVAPRTIVSIQADLPIWTRDRRSVFVRASVLNLFDQRYAYNFGNPFSGTHFGAPRTMSLAARVSF